MHVVVGCDGSDEYGCWLIICDFFFGDAKRMTLVAALDVFDNALALVDGTVNVDVVYVCFCDDVDGTVVAGDFDDSIEVTEEIGGNGGLCSASTNGFDGFC